MSSLVDCTFTFIVGASLSYIISGHTFATRAKGDSLSPMETMQLEKDAYEMSKSLEGKEIDRDSIWFQSDSTDIGAVNAGIAATHIFNSKEVAFFIGQQYRDNVISCIERKDKYACVSVKRANL